MSTHAKVSISDQVAEILFFEENERKPCTIDWDVLDELEKIFDSTKMIKLQKINYETLGSDEPALSARGACKKCIKEIVYCWCQYCSIADAECRKYSDLGTDWSQSF